MKEEEFTTYFAVALIACFVVLAFLKLGAKDFWASVGESRRAEIAWNMVESTDYMIPKLNGEKIFTKPPLFYWLVGASYNITGVKSEGVARIPSALAGLGVLLLVFLIAKGLYDSMTALLAPAILGTSYLFAHYMRLVELDMVFTFFVTFSFFALLRMRGEDEEDHHNWSIFFWASAGLAFMVKGPFALLFPVGSYLALVAFEKDTKLDSIKKLFTPLGVLLFFILAAPWFIYVIMYDEALPVFLGETVERMGDNKGRDFPVYYYLESLVNFAPWIIVAPFALLWSLTIDRAKSAFILSWFIVGLIIATIPSAKNYHYILPLYPALAIIVARYIAVHIKRAYGGRIFDGFNDSLAIIINIVAIALLAAAKVAPDFTKEVPKLDSGMVIFPLVLAITLFLYGVAGIVKEKNGPIWVSAIGSCYLVLVLAHTLVTPALNNQHSHKGFLLEAKKQIPASAPVFMYKMRNYQVSYYLGRPVAIIYDTGSLHTAVSGASADEGLFYIVARQKESDEVLKTVGGAIALTDTFYLPAKKTAEEKRFVLIEKKRES